MAAAPAPGSDLSHDPFWTQFRSFGYVYWLANWMELVERYAYYGVRVVLPVFMVAAFEQGGPQLTQIQKGNIYAVWAVVQSFVPILSGGFADRYGYKVNIAISTVLKIIGYLIMGYTIPLATSLAGMTLSEARAAGADRAYEIFFVGAMFLAFGTAIFKPGVQGLIANQMPRQAASLGWGIFYQMVNIGGFIGPLLAGYLRVIEWHYVFLACSVGIALNFIPLLMFQEPERPHTAARHGPLLLLLRAIQGLLEPRLFFFTISFAGFWLMFYQLFDILPNFIDDWVDSRAAASALGGLLGTSVVPTVNGGNLPQEWMINFNALLISLLAFVVAYLTGKMRSLTAIICGIAVSAIAIQALGMSMDGWWILAAIGLFSLGEMMASPTKMRYLASIAPRGKEGQYMGYVNFSVGIGWSIGSIVAGHLYEQGGDKVVLARRYLVDHAQVAQETVDRISKNDLLPFFQQTLGVDAWQTRQLLWETYQPYSIWLVFTLIGVASLVAIVVYNVVVQAADRNPDHWFNRRGNLWVTRFLLPICLLMLAATIYRPSMGLTLNTAFFGLMLVVALTRQMPGQPEAPANG